ncbi:MAG: bifunctional folylpolyglutamate synthase/dihydrofolate synthase [Anaerolineae bacterium]|nr:bifunctional folylpolyglutamate synthase/dihydrofolate synthase [Gemmatimonadaceae bacterium]
MDISLSQYGEAVDFLYARTGGGWKLGLERTEALLLALGNPHHRFPVFHVGGTNGKGSVVATLDALLRGKGWRVGRYTSPHLIDFAERILVDGRPAAGADVASWVDRWMPEIERVGATFFEATTCLAFDIFARANVDVAVVEVGLGGRLDATNVVRPLAAGVTSIGIDHTQYLGDTLEEIAAEKAGIFKLGVPGVIGERDPAIREVLRECARAVGAEPAVVLDDVRDVANVLVEDAGTTFSIVTKGAATADAGTLLRTPLVGAQQAWNVTLALAMLQIAGDPWTVSAAEAKEHLSRVWLPGRFQRFGQIILDVAHNAPSVRALAATLEAVRPARPLVALVSILGDKDWRGILGILAPLVDRFVLTSPPSVTADRRWNIVEAYDYAVTTLGAQVTLQSDFDVALGEAQRMAATALITGSFHTVGDAMLRLQLSPFEE